MADSANKHPNVAQLSSINAAYIAGLIDGEGTVTLTRKHRNENRQLAITISNTDKVLLEFVRSAIRAGKITSKRISQSHHTPSFTYAIYNRQALSLLEQVHPYLRTYKKERASVILQNYTKLTPRNGKYTNRQSQDRKDFENAVLQIKP
jgi:translation elongation factor EF-1alpha